MEDTNQEATAVANETAFNSEVVAIRFKGNNKPTFFKKGDIKLRQGDAVIASTEKGANLGFVSFCPKMPTDTEKMGTLVRIATDEDHKIYDENEKMAKETLNEAQSLAKKQSLQMQFLVCSYSLDRKSVTLYFMAEGRIDFRELVRELAKKVHARVELWQIGQRDETRLFGSIGPCNREYCCSTFFNSRESVTVKDAKIQRLDINPQKITGMCGKLMCCLKYEVETYKELTRDLPEDNETVLYKEDTVKVQNINPFTKMVTIFLPDRTVINVPQSDIKRNYEGNWIPCEGSEELMSQQRSKRAKEAQEAAQRAAANKKKKKVVHGGHTNPQQNQQQNKQENN
ncbi:MAG: stage 0 sporulation protein [Caldiserica bacterium]|nr:stage 0 sporulation protein [Caldisericota bacterium]